MSSNEKFEIRNKQFNEQINNISIDIINNNNIDILHNAINDLRQRRTELLRNFTNDVYIQHKPLQWRLFGDYDFDKSVEYEAILTASLQLIKKNNNKNNKNKNNNNWLHIIFILNIWSLIIYILKEYYI
jgi:hypothetical protein